MWAKKEKEKEKHTHTGKDMTVSEGAEHEWQKLANESDWVPQKQSKAWPKHWDLQMDGDSAVMKWIKRPMNGAALEASAEGS